MDNPVLALLLPSLLIVPAMGLLSSVRSHNAVSSELRRKALHLGTGLAALSFPMFLTGPWMVAAALTLVAGWMLAVRVIPFLSTRFGCVLHDTGRKSYGELYFAFAVAGLLLLSRDNPVFYAVPLLILTLADAAAAVVGRAFPVGKLGGLGKGKTIAGSATFAACAYLVTSSFLASYTTLAFPEMLAVALSMALLTCLVEAISSRGFDNIAVPAVAWLVLHLTIGGV